jgi:pimeloyl-ACP methyl ester carboxylesterase
VAPTTPRLELRRPLLASTTRFEQRDVEALGMRLRYVDVGPTEPGAHGTPLLLVHGHTSRIEEYEDIVPHLARTHRVLVPDLPGCGYSDKPNHPYSLELYEDALLAFLDATGVQQARMGGGSLGGNLTLRLGHRLPDRFPELAAWAPAGAWQPTKVIADVGKAMGRAAGRFLFWPFVWVQSRYWYEARWPRREQTLRDTFAYYREVMGPGFARMYFEVAFDQFLHSHFPYAAKIAQPTLLGWGDRDHGLKMGEGVKRLAQLIPRSELKIFAGARHSLANEVPDQLAGAVLEFFERARPATAGTAPPIAV